jgi:ATP-dependent DNA helicase RecG
MVQRRSLQPVQQNSTWCTIGHMTDFLDVGQRSVDSLPLRGVTPDVLDRTRVATHISDAVARGRYTGPTDPETYLRQKQCLVTIGDEDYPTLAGVLCFAHAPQAVVPTATVDLGHYRGVDPVSYDVTHLDKGIGGTIFEQLARVEAYLWNNTHHGMTVASDSFQRIEVHEYPQIVIRELGVNMLAHRDYVHAQAAARVMLFGDRIEWVSPGGLPPGITVDNLLEEQAPRNHIVLSMLYEAGYMEGFGQGLDTVVTVLKNEGIRPPVFRDTGASFIVTVYGRPEQRSNDAQHAVLTPTQRQILSFIQSQGETSPAQLRRLLADRSPRSIQRDVGKLVEAGFVSSIGEGRATVYYPADART